MISDNSRNSIGIVDKIKDAARGRWQELLSLPTELTDGKGHPCPVCAKSGNGGDDRFNVDRDFAQNGKMFCRKCNPKGSDGIGSYALLNGLTNTTAIATLRGLLGIQGVPASEPKDTIAEVCRIKNMDLRSFMKFGVIHARRSHERCARVNIYNEFGRVHSYFDLFPDDEIKGKCKAGKGNAGMFFPGRLPVPGETWCIVEGVKDASKLDELGFNAAGLPTSYLHSKYAGLFKRCHIVLVPDLDSTGVKGAQRSGGNLAGIAASVKIARLPGEIVAKDGDDVRKVVARAGGESMVRTAIANASDWAPTGPEEVSLIPWVEVTLDEGSVAQAVVARMGRLGIDPDVESLQVFQRGGRLVQVIPSETGETVGGVKLILGTPSIRSMPTAIIRERITQSCVLYHQSTDEDGMIHKDRKAPPRWLIESIEDRGWYDGMIRHLNGVVTAPTIRRDGSLLQVPGWDKKTGLIYRPNAIYPTVPESPTRHDAIRSIIELDSVVRDFPFKSNHDRLAWISMVLSLVARECVDGCVPLFAVTANVRGAGKSLLVDAATLIAFGRPAARKIFDHDDAEMKKSITSIAMEAIPSVLFDNMDRRLGGAALDGALTSLIWTDRLLGKNETTGELPLRTVWSATGNNLEYGSDVGRRVLPIRLDSPEECPEERTGFMYPDLLGWVSDNRPRLATAALTVMRSYYVAGCPPQPNGQWGSYESWSALIRGAIVWCDMPDPFVTKESAKSSDSSRDVLGLLIDGLLEIDPERRGMTSAEIGENFDRSESMREAVSVICGSTFDNRKFGNKMKVFIGRNLNDQRIEIEPGRSRLKKFYVGPRPF